MEREFKQSIRQFTIWLDRRKSTNRIYSNKRRMLTSYCYSRTALEIKFVQTLDILGTNQGGFPGILLPGDPGGVKIYE